MTKKYYIRNESIGLLVYDILKKEYIYHRDRNAIHRMKHEIIRYISRDTINASKNRLISPLRIYYDINFDCNLSCWYCYNKDMKNYRKRNELDLHEKFYLLDQMKDLGIFRLSIAGGEPFLNEDLFPFIERAKNLDIDVSVTSNGTCLNNHIMSFLKKDLIKRLTISVDLLMNNNPSYKHGKERCFERVCENIRKLKRDTNIDIALKSVFNLDVTNENIVQFIHFAKRHEITTIKFSFIRLYYETNPSERTELINQKYHECLYKIYQITREEKQVKIIYPNNFFNNHYGDIDATLGWGCPAGKTLLYINPYGDIKPCVMFDDTYIVGNIFEGIEYAWQKLDGFFKSCDECLNCKYINHCYGGCRSRAIQFKKSRNAKDIFCFNETEGDYYLFESPVNGMNNVFCLAHM